MELKELQKKCHDLAIEKGFWIPTGTTGEVRYRNISELLMLIVSELGEACEALRNDMHHIIPKTDRPLQEEWRRVGGYEESYEVSNLGKVRSLNMKVLVNKGSYTKKGRVLKPGLGKEGYRTVSLKGKTYKVARLVAFAFLSPPNKNNYILNHIDGNKQNDYVTNLEWGTSSNNNRHAFKYKLRVMDKKLDMEKCLEILAKFKYGKIPIKKLAEEYNVHETAIKNAKKRAEYELGTFEMEIADVVIRVMDMCEALHINLDWQIEQKLNYNKTRPIKHGKKF